MILHFLELIKFVSVIVNLPALVEFGITQADDHIKIRLTSQLINVISRALHKLLKYFNDAIISTSFVLSSSGVFPVIFILDLNDWKSVKLLFGSSL